MPTPSEQRRELCSRSSTGAIGLRSIRARPRRMRFAHATSRKRRTGCAEAGEPIRCSSTRLTAGRSAHGRANPSRRRSAVRSWCCSSPPEPTRLGFTTGVWARRIYNSCAAACNLAVPASTPRSRRCSPSMSRAVRSRHALVAVVALSGAAMREPAALRAGKRSTARPALRLSRNAGRVDFRGDGHRVHPRDFHLLICGTGEHPQFLDFHFA